ncbi:MAG: DsrE/DsrF/DrsH-like family protein [Planctomycetota bacterium]
MTGATLHAVDDPATAAAAAPAPSAPSTRTASFLVFSGELDRLLMAFTLANGAAASGLRTTMFFTFWSLAALRQGKAARRKNPIEAMFGWMIPRGTRALPMSRLNFLGMGPRLIRWRMGRRGVASLEQQIAVAQGLGVEFVACETSMDLMGFQREEMLQGVAFGGVAQCLASSASAEVAMVI